MHGHYTHDTLNAGGYDVIAWIDPNGSDCKTSFILYVILILT